jgi:hypothetical protein
VCLDDAEYAIPDGNGEWERKWVRETAALAEKIGRKCDGSRLGRDILKNDRR